MEPIDEEVDEGDCAADDGELIDVPLAALRPCVEFETDEESPDESDARSTTGVSLREAMSLFLATEKFMSDKERLAAVKREKEAREVEAARRPRPRRRSPRHGRASASASAPASLTSSLMSPPLRPWPLTRAARAPSQRARPQLRQLRRHCHALVAAQAQTRMRGVELVPGPERRLELVLKL